MCTVQCGAVAFRLGRGAPPPITVLPPIAHFRNPSLVSVGAGADLLRLNLVSCTACIIGANQSNTRKRYLKKPVFRIGGSVGRSSRALSIFSVMFSVEGDLSLGGDAMLLVRGVTPSTPSARLLGSRQWRGDNQSSGAVLITESPELYSGGSEGDILCDGESIS